MLPFLYVYLIYIYKYTEDGTNGKWQLPFVCYKQKRQTSISFLQKNGKWKFVFLGRQWINCDRRLLFQHMCPSVQLTEHSFFFVCLPICSYWLELHSAYLVCITTCCSLVLWYIFGDGSIDLQSFSSLVTAFTE
jgi:hypothetical protein